LAELLLNISAMVSFSDMEPRSDRRNEIIAGIIIGAIVLVGIAYYFSKSSPQAAPPGTAATSTTASSSSSSTSVTINGNSATSTDGYTIKPIYATAAPTAPSYKIPLVFSDPSVTADERTSMQTQFAQVQAVLVKTPQDFNSWIALGDLRKEAGDYAGAALDWQYMSKLYPSNIVSNANLGDLYTNYLPDYPKAAAALKAQIANDPTDVYIYDDLYSLYTHQYPQSTATIVALLKAGIAANPAAAELKADLAKYQ
jgi:tetratricopeptide (TPR) repeat protein